MADQATSLFSAQWRRVAQLKPRLRSHVKIERQTFGGQVWFLILDPTTGRSHRLSPAVHHFVAGMDGERTMEALWFRTHERLGDDAPSQEDCIQILAQLHNADILICHLPPDFREIVERGRAQRRKQTFARFKNPLGIRIPLVDPDRFLTRTIRFVAPLMTPFGLIVWLAFLAFGLVLAGMHWNAFTSDFADRVLAADNLIVLLATFPIVKALHELGHGYAIKRWGGEVHEIGIMFLVFIPVPYVDAAGSTGFREKWKRAFVGAAGIMTEIPIAIIALIIWSEAEPGLVRAIAYNTVLITGISTLLFNANPLLRYDGYYVLADLIEMPNLATRANKYMTYLAQRYLLRARNTTSPVDRPDERWKLATYAILSFLYRMLIWVSIILLVASKFFIIGVALAIWAAWLMAGWPLFKAARYLVNSPALSGKRQRALGVAGGALGAIALIFFVIPAPLATIVEGVVWTPERAELRIGRSGVVRDIFAQAQDEVIPGDPILAIEDPITRAETVVTRLREKEIALKFRAALSSDPFLAGMAREELEEAGKRVEHAERKLGELDVKAGAAGRLIMATASDLPGQYVERGDLVGYVKGETGLVIRAVVPESEIALVRDRARRAHVRLISNPGVVHNAVIRRIGPSSTRKLPNPALSTEGGGRFSLDPAAQSPGQALTPFYEIELDADSIDDQNRIGGRAYIRIDLGREPLGAQIYRRARQVFLERLNV